MSNTEIQKREAAARAAIVQTVGTEDGECGAGEFISHHLEELEPEYWSRHLGTQHPAPAQVVSILELRGHWSADNENGLDVFDFTLPGDVTDYVISVRFTDAGAIEDISMES